MSGLESFLVTVPIFRDLTEQQLREIAPLCLEEFFPAGTVILQQGGQSDALYFLRSGRLAVNVRKGVRKDTVAHLAPPAVFGELSFITGRPCSADVEVTVDAHVVVLPRSAVPRLREHRESLLRNMMTVIAERLHDTVSKGAKAPESPVVLLRNHAHWEAPETFAREFGMALARDSHQDTLVATFGPSAGSEIRQLGNNAFAQYVRVDDNLRATAARLITEWKRRFVIVVLNPLDAARAAEIEPFAEVTGDLLGPGDGLPVDSGFVVQSAVKPTLPRLDGSHQLIWDSAETGAPSARFCRTAGSIARHILKTQVGVALGGGAAWGWAHIGVLKVLEDAGLPIDVISGCSMGSVIGSFRSFGMSVPELMEIAEYWKSRTGRFVEWRFWRMCLLNEGAVRKTFAKYFGDRQVNQTEIPYWANAVDIANGREFTITDGSLVDAVRASIALPGLIPPAKRGNHLLVDAGIMDPVPVNLIRRMGCRYAIAVNAMARLEDHAVSTRYPFNMFDIMLRCTRIMGHEIGAARAEDSANVSLTPSLGKITMLQFARAPEIIECGRAVAEEHLPAILAGYEQVRARPPVTKAEPVEQRL